MKLISVLISLVISIFGFAGGGGSSSGGGGSSSSSHSSSSHSSSSHSSSSDSTCEGAECIITPVVFAGFVIGVFALAKHSTKENIRKIKEKRDTINSTEQAKQILKEARRIFETYQADWGNFDLASIATYTTPQYYEHASLMLELLKSLSRVNVVSKLKIRDAYLEQPVNDSTQLPAKVRVRFVFDGLDEVTDTKTNETLYSDFATYATETWSFIYDGTTIKLDGISQPTESSSYLIKSLAEFSHKNHLFYSPDWGRYALPNRGLIFNNSSMSKSDVNNHIVGKWGDLLIQLYTYSEIPGDHKTYYIVGQITVPKEYLGVVVKSKKQHLGAMRRLKKTYNEYKVEWSDFNKRYEIYAAKSDALPAFELLNPKFMEYLYAKNPNYSIEVIGSNIYIFANIRTVQDRDYFDLLDILSAAYRELKQ